MVDILKKPPVLEVVDANPPREVAQDDPMSSLRDIYAQYFPEGQDDYNRKEELFRDMGKVSEIVAEQGTSVDGDLKKDGYQTNELAITIAGKTLRVRVTTEQYPKGGTVNNTPSFFYNADQPVTVNLRDDYMEVGIGHKQLPTKLEALATKGEKEKRSEVTTIGSEFVMKNPLMQEEGPVKKITKPTQEAVIGIAKAIVNRKSASSK